MRLLVQPLITQNKTQNNNKQSSDMDNELFGEMHEQEENGLYGKRHERELLGLSNVVETKKKFYCWAVTGTFHGSIIEAETEGEARRIFHKYYNGESITYIKKRN